MINAFDARELVKNSDESLKLLLEQLDKPIRDAATAGKNTIDVSLGHVGVGVETLNHPRWARLGAELKHLGFRMSVESREVRYGLGASRDDDDPREYNVLALYW